MSFLRAIPALLLASTFAAEATARAQTCCGRLDLPLAATQRGGNRDRELLLAAFYEYDRLANGRIADGFGTAAITSHRLVLTAAYGVTSWLTPELSAALAARAIDQRIGGEEHSRSVVSVSDTTLLLKLAPVGYDALAPGALRLTVAPGIKLPTGRYRQSDEYGRIPPPTQIGTGAVDLVLALFGAFGLDGEAGTWLLLSSAAGRYGTENGEGYRPGHSLDLASAVQLSAFAPVTLRLGPFLRLTAADEQDGVELAASGGTVLGLRAGASYSLSDQLAFSLDLQVPLYRQLEGAQLDPIVTGSAGVLLAL